MGARIDPDDAQFATIALNHKLTTKGQLKKVFKEQIKREKLEGFRPPIGDMMVELQLISPEERTAIQRAAQYKRNRREDKILGRILVEAEYLEKPFVTKALREQKAYYGKSGKILRMEEVLMRDERISDYQLFAAKKIRDLKIR